MRRSKDQPHDPCIKPKSLLKAGPVTIEASMESPGYITNHWAFQGANLQCIFPGSSLFAGAASVDGVVDLGCAREELAKLH